MEVNGSQPNTESELIRQMQALVDFSSADSAACDSLGTDFIRCVTALQQVWPDDAAGELAEDDQPAEATGTSRRADELPHATNLRRFEIRRMLGHGGFGVVLLAFDEILSREVALKIPRPPFLLSAELRSRFLREAQSAAVLDHPGIVPVYEAGELGPVCYIAAGYVKGMSLAEWLGSAALPDFRTSALLIALLADAVHHAHSRGILHRDLKPSNVMLEPAEPGISPEFPFIPKLTDFGLAKRIENIDDQTLSGELIGTPRYMAPEQAANQRAEIGVATDVYGLGAILHELLCGEPPFVGESNADVLKQIQQQELSPIRLRDRGVPNDLETICLKCLAKESGRRYQSARHVADDLRRFLDGTPVLARPISRPEKFARWCRRRPVVAGLTAALAIAVTAGTTIALWQWYRAEQHLTESIAATAEAEDQQRRAEQALLDLAWLVEESTLWGQESSQFGDAVQKKLKRYYETATRPGDSRWSPVLAAIYSFDAQRATAKSDFATADSKYRLALDAWREANRDHPQKSEYRRALALCLRNFSLLTRGRSQASGASEPSAALRDFYCNLLTDERYGAGFLRDYAELMFDHGGLLATQNRKVDARYSLEVGIVAAELLLEKNPADAPTRFLVGKLWRCLADVQAGQRQHSEAVTSVDRAIEAIETLAAADPERPEYLVELSAAYYRRAVMEPGAGAQEREVDWLQKSIDLAERVSRTSGENSANRLRHAIALRTLAQSLRRLNRTDEAWAVSQRHGEQLERMAQHQDIIPPDEYRSLARAYHQRGIQANAANDGESGAAAFEKGATAFEKAVGFKFGVIDILLWAECHYFLARNSENSGNKPSAVEHYERAVELLKDLAAKRDANAAVKDRYRRSVAALAELKQPESTTDGQSSAQSH